jgi:hypothetical protein
MRPPRLAALFDFPGDLLVTLLTPEAFDGREAARSRERSNELHLLPAFGATGAPMDDTQLAAD